MTTEKKSPRLFIMNPTEKLHIYHTRVSDYIPRTGDTRISRKYVEDLRRNTVGWYYLNSLKYIFPLYISRGIRADWDFDSINVAPSRKLMAAYDRATNCKYFLQIDRAGLCEIVGKVGSVK